MIREPLVRIILATLTLLTVQLGLAHATLVFVDVTSDPSPPRAGEPLVLRIDMRDPVDAPVEDAIVFVEATAPSGGALVTSDRFEEVDPGVYETTLTLAAAGDWTLLFRDRTFRQEEANATITLGVGPTGTAEALTFIFPPTATGPQSLTTWLIWLVGLPLVAGLVVTVMVLRGGSDAPVATTDAHTDENAPAS